AGGGSVTPLSVPASPSFSQALSPGQDPGLPMHSPDHPSRPCSSSMEEGNKRPAAIAGPHYPHELAQGSFDRAAHKPSSAGREAQQQQQQQLQLRRPSTREKHLQQQQQQRPSTREREAEAAFVEASNADWLAHQAAMSAQYLATDFLRGTAGSELRRVATRAAQGTSPDLASSAHISPTSSSSTLSQPSTFQAGKVPPLSIPPSAAAGRSPQASPLKHQGSPQGVTKARLAATAPPSLQQHSLDDGGASGEQCPASSPFAKAAIQAHADGADQPGMGSVGEEQPVRCKTPPFVKGRQQWMGVFGASPLLTHRDSFVVEEHNNAVPAWDGPIPPGSLAFEKAHCDQLCFLRRVEPQRTRLLTRLNVVADLLAARKLANSVG
ncbi:hypothetical protein DUNSADRAFT_2984, partial [Dunaliella salina]